MADKLNSGDAFPGMTLDLVDGTKLQLPDGLDAKYKVIVFYRGHW
jgi:peroxiredoxin